MGEVPYGSGYIGAMFTRVIVCYCTTYKCMLHVGWHFLDINGHNAQMVVRLQRGGRRMGNYSLTWNSLRGYNSGDTHSVIWSLLNDMIKQLHLLSRVEEIWAIRWLKLTWLVKTELNYLNRVPKTKVHICLHGTIGYIETNTVRCFPLSRWMYKYCNYVEYYVS